MPDLSAFSVGARSTNLDCVSSERPSRSKRAARVLSFRANQCAVAIKNGFIRVQIAHPLGHENIRVDCGSECLKTDDHATLL